MADELVLIGGALGGLLVISVAAKSLRGGAKRRLALRIRKRVDARDYDGAAKLATDAGDMQAAYEIYVRAQLPHKAAQVALLQGRASHAGELFERAGDKRRAAAAFRQAGMVNRANSLEPSRSSMPPGRPGSNPPGKAIASPAERALAAEEHWRSGTKMVRNDDADGLARLTAEAEKLVELWLSAGEIKRAADVCREAGLVEQAVSLYVNVLGDPGTAAQLVVARRDFKRAAELFEAAGQKDKALAAWVEWSKEADDPLEHLADVERLGEAARLRLFQVSLQARPISQANLELYYRVGVALTNDPKRAKAVLERVAAVDPTYKDVTQRIRQAAQAMTALEGSSSSIPPPRRSDAPPPMSANYGNLVGEAAQLAAAMLREQMGTQDTMLAAAPRQAGRGATPVSMLLAADPLIREARRGPSVAELRSKLPGPPAADNVELYYRVGLAQLAHGQYGDAQQTFRQVESVSPGYRDSAARTAQIEEWKAAMGPSSSGGAGSVPTRYTILGELGRGGMAVVYRARDEALGREVALKFLTEEAVGNEVFMQFFQREARAAGSLNHPNIVTIYDVGAFEGRAFICMELVDGVSLDAIVEKDKRLPVVEVLRTGEQVLSALEYAHQRKIIHRDIKPANIMRSSSGLVKLMDFGLAKSIDAQKSAVISGTPSYMAPEQLTGKGVDGRTDLFALGATMYELIVGEVPFTGMLRFDPPRRPREVDANLPPALEELLMRSMEFDQGRRFATAAEMLEPVRALLAELDPAGSRRPLSMVPPRPQPGTVLGVGGPSDKDG